MSAFVIRAIKRIGEIIAVIGGLIFVGGVFWLRNFGLDTWSFKLCLLIIGAGVVIAGLGAGLLKLARSRESTTSPGSEPS